MLGGLSDRLKGAIDKLSKGSVDKQTVDDAVRDIQRALLSADVDVKLVFSLTENIRRRAFENVPQGLTRREHVVKVVYDELVRILGEHKSAISLTPKKILLIGLYGSGKTSTAAKLARFYQKKGLKPLLVACDTFRPAAFEQLEQLAKRIEVPFYGEKGEKDASKIARNALKSSHADILIVDSSGRNALDESLIKEIKGIHDAMGRADERILVIPADIGQAAKQQAAAFHEALGITDVIVTKLDATAKGGGALTACHATGAGIRFITVGETPEDLEIYDPEKFVSRLLGFPDLETLLEKARSVVDEKKAEKIVKGDFDIEDFYSQIESMQKMGPMSQMLEMAGFGRMAGKMDTGKQESKMKRWRYMIQSMTADEKANPETINASRIKRIAKGSGSQESDVRELVASYSKVKKMMKQISPGKLKRGGMAGLFRQFGIR